jgi:hypothetical protein
MVRKIWQLVFIGMWMLVFQPLVSYAQLSAQNQSFSFKINQINDDSAALNEERNYPLDKVKPFDEKEYKEITQGIDYTEKKPEIEEHKTSQEIPIEEPKVVGFMGLGQVALIVVLAIVVIVLIYFIARQIPKSNPNVKASDDWFAEALEQEGGPELALQKKLQDAIDKREFALALRMLFLQILADLHLAEQIVWKKDKTNAMYIVEFGARSNDVLFRRITYLYEFSWFGKAKLNQEQFNDYRKLFDEFRSYSSTLNKNQKV